MAWITGWKMDGRMREFHQYQNLAESTIYNYIYFIEQILLSNVTCMFKQLIPASEKHI